MASTSMTSSAPADWTPCVKRRSVCREYSYPRLISHRLSPPRHRATQAAMMSRALENVIRLLDLEELEVNIFRGLSPKEDRQRVFGGQVAGQALVAARRTVDAGHVHSLHCYFLRPGDPKIPILYEVDRIRDGRSFTTRRVVAIQHGRAIFNLDASFHKPEPGLEYHAPMPQVRPPEELPSFAERLKPFREQLGDWVDRERPIDIRICDPSGRRPEEW